MVADIRSLVPAVAIDNAGKTRSPSGVMKGGPGNPLGARILLLDDGSLSIHGTNATRPISTTGSQSARG
jgi:lipoprotein-anchoring transpeptidase ErfK/SrfK